MMSRRSKMDIEYVAVVSAKEVRASLALLEMPFKAFLRS